MNDNNVLLIGNGLNRCYSDISWFDLLHNIARNNFVSDETISSMTLAFEQIVNSAASFTKGNMLTKQTLKELKKLDVLKPGYDSLIKEFVKLPVNIILTTNFDYAIERTIVPTFSYENNKGDIAKHNETYRSTIRHTKIEDKRIFHIHGELGMEKTICLGTVHYMANLTKLIEKLTTETEDDTIEFDQSLLLKS